MGRVLSCVRGGDRFIVLCSGSLLPMLRGEISVSMSGRGMRSVLGVLSRRTKLGCGVGGQRVAIDGMGRRTPRRRMGRMGIAKGILSRGNRKIPKTGIIMGNGGTRNAVASVRKGFALAIPTGAILMTAFVNCVPARFPLGNGAGIVLGVAPSAGRLSRIIIIKFNTRGGTDMMKTMRAMGTDRLHSPSDALDGSFTKHVTNMMTMRHNNRPNTSKTGF